MGTECYVFDIDGTLLDISHRLHHIKAGNKNWAVFRAEALTALTEVPRMEVINLLVVLSDWHNIVFVTGRVESEAAFTFGPGSPLYKTIKDHFNGITYDWWDCPTTGLFRASMRYMRKEGDYRHDDIIKAEMLAQIKADGYHPVMAFDDRPRVIRMWREHGVPVTDVGPGVEF